MSSKHPRSPAEALVSTQAKLHDLGSPQGSSSGGSANTQTFYQPSTGNDPSGKMDRLQRQQEIRREMDKNWVEGDESIIADFFMPNSISAEEIEFVKWQFYDKRKNRWKGIPTDISNEKILAGHILSILQVIHQNCRVGLNRAVLDTQDHNVPTHNSGKVRPDLMVSVLDALVSPATVHEMKPTSFKMFGSFIEAKREKMRHKVKDSTQLATYSREIFMAQSNRRFIPSLFITERVLEFFLFDRSGALRSARFDYHKHPERTCEVFASLLKLDAVSLGFDHTVFYRTPSTQCIRTMEVIDGRVQEVTYIVEGLIMRSYTIIGLGTTFWNVRREGDLEPSRRYILKDSWITDGVDEEALMRDIGSINHVAPLVHSEVILTQTGQIDSTFHNRLGRHAVLHTTDRFHHRTVYQTSGSGKLLEQFENPVQVLAALRDAIQGHGNLLERGIIYRDIVPWNILIPSVKNKKGESSEGSGGLIDLDRAVRTTTTFDPAEQTPGSYIFHPRSVLANEREFSHINLLENFAHILFFFTVGHKGPPLVGGRKEPCPDLEGYGATVGLALNWKSTLIETEKFKYTVHTEYFKQPTAQLAVDLHSFFHTKWKNAYDANKAGIILPPSYPAADYLEVITHFNKAIEALLLGNIKSLDAPKEYSETHDLSEPTTATQTRKQKTHKRTVSGALGKNRQNASRACKRLRGSYTQYVL